MILHCVASRIDFSSDLGNKKKETKEKQAWTHISLWKQGFLSNALYVLFKWDSVPNVIYLQAPEFIAW